MLVQTIIDSLFQLLLFSFIPFIYWFFVIRNEETLLQWIGLKKVKFYNKAKTLLFSVTSFVLLFASGIILVAMVGNTTVIATTRFTSMGMKVLLPILFYSIIQTGLSEEIFFRGFILKLCKRIWNVNLGNFIQSILFGLLHGVILLNVISPLLIVLVILFSALAGWIMGYINEYLGNESILPSWVIHSLMNICSSLLIAFNII